MRPFLICFFLSVACSAQDIVTYADLTFSSEAEKAAFDTFFNKKVTDHFGLFISHGQLLTASATEQASQRFSSYLSNIEGKTAGRKNDKKIKLLYEDIHKNFLSKYEMENRFENIFYNGTYNCVSATALFALAFEHLKIPYTIKEQPQHVYLIAYPEQENIKVETTTAQGGYIQPGLHFKQNFVRVLREQKLISAQEAAGKSMDELFDKYYFGKDATITLIQLIGIQYMNAGIELMQIENFTEAFNAFEKAYMFYPSERIAYLLLVCGYNIFSKASMTSPRHVSILARLSRFGRLGMTPEMIEAEYYQVMQKLLFDNGDLDAALNYHQQLDSLIQSESTKSGISFLHHFEVGRYFYNKGRYKESIPYFEKCMEFKPKHEATNRNLIVALAESSRLKPNLELIRMFEDYGVKYPSFAENNIFNEILGSVYLRQVLLSYQSGKASEGDVYLKKFESFFQLHSDVPFDSRLVGDAYSEVAVFHFRKGNTTKARAVVNKGLEISPNNFELEARKHMLRN